MLVSPYDLIVITQIFLSCRKMTPMTDQFSHSKRSTKVQELAPIEAESVRRFNPTLLQEGTKVAVVHRAERRKLVFERFQEESTKRHQDSYLSYFHNGMVCYGAVHGFYSFSNQSSKQWLALVSPFAKHHQQYPFTNSPDWVFKRLSISREQLAVHISAVKHQK